jgi:hypothetical protein
MEEMGNITVFWLVNLEGRDHSEDIGVDGKVILQWIVGRLGWEGVYWIHLAQNRDQWWALVNRVMNLGVL